MSEEKEEKLEAVREQNQQIRIWGKRCWKKMRRNIISSF